MACALVVDDEESVRHMLRRLLEGADFRVFEASNGNEALRVLDEDNVDLIIIDIIMPEKDGIETILEIRRRSPDLPIIAISGDSHAPNIDYLESARKLGANYTLRKPFSGADILNIIDEIGAKSG